MVVLKPSNKGIGHFAILFGGCNGGLGPPVSRARFFFCLPQLALEVGDSLFSRTQSRLRRHQITSGDKPLASFLCLRGNSLKPFFASWTMANSFSARCFAANRSADSSCRPCISSKRLIKSKIPKCPPAEIQRVRTRGLAITK